MIVVPIYDDVKESEKKYGFKYLKVKDDKE